VRRFVLIRRRFNAAATPLQRRWATVGAMSTYRSRTLAALATASATLSLMVAASAAAAPTATIAACTPTELPTFAGHNGEVMWITDDGLYVGGTQTDRVHPDGSPVFAGAYWTHDAGGYHIHALPGDPLVDDEVLDVNRSGRMVDYGFDPATGTSETYVFDLPTGRWWHLPGLGGVDTRGRRINASGVVAGGSLNRNNKGFAVTWAPPYTTPTRLDNDGLYPYAPGINDAGVAVGESNRQRWNPSIDDTMQHQGAHAYFPLTLPMEWLPDGTSVHLPVLFTQGEAFAINNAGTIVGSSDVNNNEVDATYWRNGRIYDMGGEYGWFTEARGLSQGGWAVGGAETGLAPGVHVSYAFIWTGAGKLQYLSALDGPDGQSNAHGVNDVLRQAGGWSDDGAGNGPPTVWQCAAGFTTG
jgi:probable HAF family extracellular repeat protein